MVYYGDNVVAVVWSFTNDLQDVPYRISIDNIKTKNGTKSKYSCTCPAFTHRKTCKHLTEFRDNIQSITQDKRYTITDYGKQILKL